MRPGSTGRAPVDCPVCSAPLNAHANTVTWSPPRPGHLTVCIHCRTVLRYTMFGLRTLSDKEHRKVMRDPNVRNALEIVDRIRADGMVPE